MDPQFWHERWELQQIGFHQQDVNPYLRKFWSEAGPETGAGVFVPLCGKSLDLLWLREQGHPVLGVELSGRAIADFFRENALPEPAISQQDGFIRWEVEGLVLLEGDFFRLRPDLLQDIGLVYDRAALVALPEQMRPRYVEHLDSLLPPGASQFLVTLEYPQSEMKGPPFCVAGDEVERLYGRRYRIEVLCSSDVLAENPHFRNKGLSRLQECAWWLKPRI